MVFWRREALSRNRCPGVKTLIFLLVISALLGPPVWLAWPVLGDPSDQFVERRGDLARYEVTRQWLTADSRYHNLTLVSSSGLQVKVTIRRPLKVDAPRPVILLLGGYDTGRTAAELVQNTGGMVVASISYPYRGPEDLDGWRLLWHFDDIQQAILDTTPAVLITLDYLASQSYVDASQVELIGVSFGAFFVSVAGAMDERFSRVWLVQGAADPRAIYEYQLRDEIGFGPLRALVSRLLGFFTATEYLKPERWVPRISPRPVVVINSRNDEAYPPATVATLHASLREPYELEWIEGPHITRSREAVLKQLNERVVERIAAGK